MGMLSFSYKTVVLIIQQTLIHSPDREVQTTRIQIDGIEPGITEY